MSTLFTNMHTLEMLKRLDIFLRCGWQSGNTTAAINGVKNTGPHGKFPRPRLVMPTEQAARDTAKTHGIECISLASCHPGETPAGPVVFDAYTVEQLVDQAIDAIDRLDHKHCEALEKVRILREALEACAKYFDREDDQNLVKQVNKAIAKAMEA